MTGCARGEYGKRTIEHPYRKLIVLPKKTKGPGLVPYVVNGQRYYPLPDSHGFVQFGKASWYGKKFHGRPTASGERFDMYKKTAAHKTLPLGTYVGVLNLFNKKKITVRINDRGPFIKGRVIDLSYAAAKEIGLIGPGVADVKIVALGRKIGELKSSLGIKTVVEARNLDIGDLTVQVGAFRNKSNALRLADRLSVIFDYVEVAVNYDKDKRITYRVRVSKSKTLARAGKMEKELRDMGFEEAFIVSL